MIKSVLPWPLAGILLAVAFLAAIAFVKPIGVSTQFVIFDGIIWDLIQPDTIVIDETAKTGFASPNAYLNKSGGKYAHSIANPVNYSFIFVISMIVGAFLSVLLKGVKPHNSLEKAMPPVWSDNFGQSTKKRYIWSFIAGFIVLFGARLAGGCTSGHMMSGIMQTALSGYLFAASAFATAIPLALILYKNK